MEGFIQRHRGAVATAVAAVALALVSTARWLTWGDADSRLWPSIAAAGYSVVAALLFMYLGTERAREALEATESSLAEARLVVAVSPTIIAALLHLLGADLWVMAFALGATVVQLVAWSGVLDGKNPIRRVTSVRRAGPPSAADQAARRT